MSLLHSLHFRLATPRPWKHLLSAHGHAEIYDIETADGQMLVLRRLVPDDPNGLPPVMMLHGLGANHRSFRLSERSMADWMVGRGHEVWLPNLRGHGDSTRVRFDWGIDEYLKYDLPAILGTIRLVSEHDEVNWIGHSMGGLLLFCYGILHPDTPIRRGVSIASGLDYKVGATGFAPLLALRPLLTPMVAVPFGTLVHMLAPAVGFGLRVEDFNFWRTNVDARHSRRVYAQCFHSIPVSLLISLATTFEDEGIRTVDGFRFEANAHRYQTPSLLVAGSRDVQVSVNAIEHTARLLGPTTEVRVFGTEYGHADEYGHFDLIVGKRAMIEVWPEIAAWLETP